jgi:alpha-galactosidase
MSSKWGVLRYRDGDDRHCLKFCFGLETKAPSITVQAELKRDAALERYSVKIHPQKPILIEELRIDWRYDFAQSQSVFCNGYQSWTESREFGLVETMPQLRWPLRRLGLKWFGDYFFQHYPTKPGCLHGYTYCYVRGDGYVDFWGSLAEHNGYTVFEIDARKGYIHIRKDCVDLALSSDYLAFDLVCIRDIDEHGAFACYVARLPHCERRQIDNYTGWTSWYNYYTQISEQIILQNLSAISKEQIPIDIFQIDDGFQTAVGDWLSIKPEFPRGMKAIAEAIKDQGYRAGLWLAPFICERKSSIYREKKHWLLFDEQKKPVVAGFNPLWSWYFYALNLQEPEVRAYLRQVIECALDDWGFDMLKLDFLYAAALQPPPGQTRGAAMFEAMSWLRELAGDRLLLGCGIPLGSAFGLVDYCRIGSDVALKWEDKLLRFGNYRERVSTINSLISTIGRRHLNGAVFGNDPDVFFLRHDNIKLSPNQKNTLFMLNNIFGKLVFTSDDISRYSKTEKRLYRSMFPLRSKSIHRVMEDNGCYTIEFSIGDNQYVAVANLTEQRRDITLQEGIYFANQIELDQGDFTRHDAVSALEAYSSRCYLRISDQAYTIAGSTGHLFAGSEVSRLSRAENCIYVQLDPRYVNAGDLWLRVPELAEYRINDAISQSHEIFDGLYVVKARL